MMSNKKTRVVILGAGISGLSCGFFIKQLLPNVALTILEKEKRPGGCIKTLSSAGFCFEAGPRTFSVQRSEELLALVQDLGLTDQLIFSNERAKARYIWKNHRFQRMENLLFSPSIIKSCFKELRIPKEEKEESIFEFAKRRFGQQIADELFDPMALGIFAGDSRELSVQACFPYFKELERNYGSLVKGFILEKWKTKKKKAASHALFNFTRGAQMLIDSLYQRLKEDVQLESPVESLQFTDQGVTVYTAAQKIEADYLISSINPQQLAAILDSRASLIKQKLCSIPFKGVHVVNVGFNESVLPLKGFGYLVPSNQHQPVLGAVFDSAIFPQLNHRCQETRMTFMLKENVIDAAQIALIVLKNQLKISKWPDMIQVNRIEKALPQFLIGHNQIISSIQDLIQAQFPRLILIGNYLTSPSVNGCIQTAKKVSYELQAKLS